MFVQIITTIPFMIICSFNFKMDCNERRLCVLRMAHRRTLHSFIPDHVVHSLQCSFQNDDVNLTVNLHEGVQQNNKVFIDPRLMPMTVVVSNLKFKLN